MLPDGDQGIIVAVDRGEITAELAARLVAGQFPQWANLPVRPVGLNGWDNTTFRLGDELTIRLPNADGYVAQIDKEHRCLPVLAGHLPLTIPEPVAKGQPGDCFPRPWSIYRWIEGEPAGTARITDQTAFAADLAAFLTALYAIDGRDGPAPGSHSAFRGGPLVTWDEQTRNAIVLLADEIDAEDAIAVWDTALASTWEQPPRWVHGDVSASNLLATDGTLHAVIDFGCAAVGDPACDLVMAWTFFAGHSTMVFRDGLSLDAATWARGRGWALWKALITISEEKQHGNDAEAAALRFGWRHSPRQVIDLVIADHARSASR